jgi:hypothetical protein
MPDGLSLVSKVAEVPKAVIQPGAPNVPNMNWGLQDAFGCGMRLFFVLKAYF